MSVWCQVKLGTVLRQRKEFVNLDDQELYKRPRVRLHAQGIVLRDEVVGALIKTKQQQVCRAGELLVAEIDAKVGGFGVVPAALEGAIVSSHYFLFQIDECKLDCRFLEFLIRTSAFRRQVEAQGSTNYASIRATEVLRYEIPLPTLSEQRRVVARLEEIAASVGDAKELRGGASDALATLSARGASALIGKLDRVERRPLSDLVWIHGGGTPSKANPFYWQGKVPWVTPKDMKSRSIFTTRDHISERALRETPAKLIDAGAVLVVVRGMILAHTVPAAVLRVPAAINQDMKALLPRPEILPDYLCGFLWAENARFLALVEKSTHDTRKLETWKLLSTEIPCPSLAAQRRIIAELDAFQAEIDRLRHLQNETAAELDALLPAVLDRAFRGELL